MLIANRSQRSCPLALQPAHIIRRRTFCDLWRKRETNKPFQFILHQFIIALIICHLPQIECLSCLCASSSVWPVCLLHITLSLGAIWFAWLTPKGESAKVEASLTANGLIGVRSAPSHMSALLDADSTLDGIFNYLNAAAKKNTFCAACTLPAQRYYFCVCFGSGPQTHTHFSGHFAAPDTRHVKWMGAPHPPQMAKISWC